MEYLIASDTRGRSTTLHVVEIKDKTVYLRIYTGGTFGIDIGVDPNDLEEMILGIKKDSADTEHSQYKIKITPKSVRVEKDDKQCLLGVPDPDGFARLKKDLHM